MTSHPPLHLASSSPRRRAILKALGLKFSVKAVVVDEYRLADEAPAQMALRLAAAKAVAAEIEPSHFVIGADTIVVLDSDVLGKPRDRDDAVTMLTSLSGRRHCVMTGVALRGPAGVQTALSTTDVDFREISRDEALAYWHSGEPRDKAGAYAIQGLGGAFVEAIHGSYSGVVGLPVYETAQLLKRAGIDLLMKQSNDG
ncbi:MAG: septum formation inhibitor Maf [Gammaproteobacteria bacterium]|nr:septum formation inhibitor Maf [Gammaproteobacteria bacterium]